MSEFKLSSRDRSMLNGELGKAAQIAMRIVQRIAKIQGATELIDIAYAHIGGSLYTGQGSLQVVETLAEYGAKVRVPTTINALSIDRQRWRSHRIDPEFAGYSDRMAAAFERMGAQPVFSCTPYIFPDIPKKGQDIVWAESNAIAYANSVLGARTNRHGDFLDICAAITGRAPLSGLHLPENRKGDFLVKVPAFEGIDSSFYTVLGYFVGKKAGSSVPVIEGLPMNPSLEDLKSFSATVATSGAVGLYHLVGITPEAATLEDAFGGKAPEKIISVSADDLRRVWEELSTGSGAEVGLVALGSPHLTLGDFNVLASLVDGKTKHPKVDLLVTTSRKAYEQAAEAGFIGAIERFGARVSTDFCTCQLNPQMIAGTSGAVMTNSGKFAHYGPGLIDRGVYFGSMADCVASAVCSKLVMSVPAWLRQ